VSKKRLILRLFLVLLIIIVGFLGITTIIFQGIADFGDAMNPSVGTLQEKYLKSDIGVSLPDEATDFHGNSYSFWQSRIVAFTFRSSPKIIDDFLKQLGLKDSLKVGLNPLRENQLPEITKFTWWKTKNLIHFSGASWTKSQTFYDVMVDMTDSNTYNVYIMVEQT